MVAKSAEKELPPLFRRHVRRPRLTQILDASTAQAILIIAPAGYGKTTLVAEWLQGKDIGVWYYATSASADVATFSAGVIDVIQPLIPNVGKNVLQRLRVPEAPDRLARILAELLAEDIQDWPADKWLVVDDYHLVAESAAVEEFVDWLLTLSPIRLVVTSRRRPTWASARRLLYGESLEVTSKQLAMTDNEASIALAETPSSGVRSVVRRSDGWPALIGLASLLTETKLPAERVSETLFSYFADEILRNESPSVQQKLLAASVLPQLDATTVSEVIKIQDPAGLMQHLSAEGLLHTVGGGRARFHPLLRDFLRRRLQTERPKLKRALERRALDYLRRQRRWDEAFDIAVAADLKLQAAEIVGDAAPELLTHGRLETLDQWITLCGPASLASPTAQLARAELDLRRGRFEGALAIARAVAASASVHPSQANAIAGEASYWLLDNSESLALHSEALDLAEQPADTRRALWGCYLASQAQNMSSSAEFLDRLEEAAGDDADYRLRVAVGRVVASSRAGSFAGAWVSLEALLPYLRWAKDPMARSSFLLHCAFVNGARCHYHDAARYAADALDICRLLRLDFALASCLAYQFEAEIARRNRHAAQRTLADLRSRASASDDAHTHMLLARCTIRWALFHRSYPTDVYEPPTLEGLEQVLRGETSALHALAHACVGEREASAVDISHALALSESAETRFMVRFASLIGDLESGSDSLTGELDQLLTDAVEAEYLDCFVTAYRAYPPLLRLASHGRHVELVGDVVSKASDRKFAARLGVALPVTGRSVLALEVLTPREAEVVGLMDRGLGNREIAGRLVISPSTAKVHVHNVVRKLGATTRLEAITRYRELSRDA